MSAILKVSSFSKVFEEIASHPAWRGNIRGLDAEKMLRGKKTPYLYILRAGEESHNENEKNYYITFVGSDLSVKHYALVVTLMAEGWHFENSGTGGPFAQVSINDVIHTFMHCEKTEAVPMVDGKH